MTTMVIITPRYPKPQYTKIECDGSVPESPESPVFDPAATCFYVFRYVYRF
jgi:hypothetical protein